MKKFKSLLHKNDGVRLDSHNKAFMEPEVIDDSVWLKDTNEVPFKRKLSKVFGNKTTRFVQDLLNCIVSASTTWLSISYTYDI